MEWSGCFGSKFKIAHAILLQFHVVTLRPDNNELSLSPSLPPLSLSLYIVNVFVMLS